MSRLLISPVTAVTCDDDFRVIKQAALQIQDGVLQYVGPATEAPPFEPERTLGGEHFVAIPGLINTHTHAAMTLLRGYADDMALEPWLQTRIWPFESHLRAEDVYHGTRLAIAEMLRGGTTCFADMYHFYDEGVRAMLETGIRACPGAVLLGFLPQPAERMARGRDFVRQFRGAGNGRIQPMLAPHSLYTCNPEQWRTMVEYARELGVPLHTHAAETRREVEEVTATWGAPPLRALQRCGALDGHLLAAHCIYLSLEELGELAADGKATHLHVAHNPTSNLKLASGFAPIPQYLEQGITVGLAPDGTASNNNLDMWEEMRLAALLHKGTHSDPTVVTAHQALLMATREGARCLGLEEVTGSLAKGKRADVVLVDFDQPHLYPRHNVVSNLVYAAGAGDVHSVLVEGEVLVENGEFTRLDVQEICHAANACAVRLAGAHSATELDNG